MLVVRVELHSAITGKVTEIGQMHIYNDGSGTVMRGNYEARAFRGEREPGFGRLLHLKRLITRKGRVENYARNSKSVWCLVAEALKAMNYKVRIR